MNCHQPSLGPLLACLAFAAVGFGPFPPANTYAEGPSPQEIRRALATNVPEDPAAVVAVVGNTPVLAGDLLPRIEGRVKEITEKTESTPSAEELHYMRAVMFRSLLSQTIQLKMLRESFLLSQVGTQAADKRREAEQKLQARARQMFTESELPRLYEKLDVNTIDDVDRRLREIGSSFESHRRDFIDQMLAHLYRSDAIPKDPDVNLVEIQQFYEDHVEDYRTKDQARWEQLTASFEKSGTRESTLMAIIEMGKEAYFGGSMQAVAKLKSHEPFAARGGLHEWTNRGSLASDRLEQQIFSLPIGVMSEIIEDETGMHIVRVLERRPAGVRPLSELQDEIREKVKKEKIDEAIKRVTEQMNRRVPVWTLFPDDIEGSMQLESVDSGLR